MLWCINIPKSRNHCDVTTSANKMVGIWWPVDRFRVWARVRQELVSNCVFDWQLFPIIVSWHKYYSKHGVLVIFISTRAAISGHKNRVLHHGFHWSGWKPQFCDFTDKWLIYRGYPAKRALPAMLTHGRKDPFGRIPTICVIRLALDRNNNFDAYIYF